MESSGRGGSGSGERTAQDALRFFCQHLVGLSMKYTLPDGMREMRAYSGFLLEVRGVWFYATAGHSLVNLFQALPRCANVTTHLHDAWGTNAVQSSIPFPLVDSWHVEVDEDESGLDVGLVVVEAIIRRNLEANGIRAFNEKAWRDPPLDMEAHKLLGIPDQLTTKRIDHDQDIVLGVRPTLLSLTQVPAPPEMEKSTPSFYGKLADRIADSETGGTLDELSGLSGGPILGFRRNSEGQLKYWLVAVQSAWRRDLRVVRGPLMSELARQVDLYLSEQRLAAQ
jgi:hypothetical protein